MGSIYCFSDNEKCSRLNLCWCIIDDDDDDDDDDDVPIP